VSITLASLSRMIQRAKKMDSSKGRMSTLWTAVQSYAGIAWLEGKDLPAGAK